MTENAKSVRGAAMGSVGGISALRLRRSATLACEVAAFSALGASLAWLMWAAIEPVGSLDATTPLSPSPGKLDKLNTRLSLLPQISMSGGSQVPLNQLAAGIVLHATRAGLDGDGAAILSIGGAPQTTFAVGDELALGSRLVKVAADHIEIDSSGQRYRLEFTRAERAASVLQPTASPESRSPPVGQLMNSLPLQSVRRAGGQAAFAVTAHESLSAFGGSGLQPGDILLKIDGVDVSAANLASYAAQIQSGRTFEVTFERNGQVSTTRIGKSSQ
jgi:general secretion pathway protein C